MKLGKIALALSVVAFASGIMFTSCGKKSAPEAYLSALESYAKKAKKAIGAQDLNALTALADDEAKLEDLQSKAEADPAWNETYESKAAAIIATEYGE